MIHIRFGLKLWSINTDLIEDAYNLVKSDVFQYVELTPIPCTNVEPFLKYDLPYVIHVATENSSVNIADRNKRNFNLTVIKECGRWAYMLNAKHMILHPGYNSLSGTKDFLDGINDRRILIENMPKVGIKGEDMSAYLPSHINELMGEKFGFCFDINHAMKAAISLHKDYKQFASKFIMCKPKVIHVSDGHLDNEKDEHLRIGKGDYDIGFFAELISRCGPEYVTIECQRLSNTLNESVEDLQALTKHFRKDLPTRVSRNNKA